jgi:hypothetical protein
MVAADMGGIADSDLERVRIFTRASRAEVAPRLRPVMMPYDSRFDGPDSPIAGTRSDFAARALWHFATKVLKRAPQGTAASHARAVRGIVSRFRDQQIPIRLRRSDEELLELITEHWSAAGGRKTRLLRILRDDLGVACEQARFNRLVALAEARASL